MPLQISSIVGTELLAPDSNGFIRDDDSTFGEKILDIREAHAEAVINPGGVADDFRREPIAVIARLVALHRTSLSVLRPKLTMPHSPFLSVEFLHRKRSYTSLKARRVRRRNYVDR
jgi:hypothetical protein